MKKLILLLAVCFGVFMCQNVTAQLQNLQSTPIVKQVVTPTSGNTTNQLSNATIATPVNLNGVQAPARTATASPSTSIQNQQLSAVSILKNATPVQINNDGSSNGVVSPARASNTNQALQATRDNVVFPQNVQDLKDQGIKRADLGN